MGQEILDRDLTFRRNGAGLALQSDCGLRKLWYEAADRSRQRQLAFLEQRKDSHTRDRLRLRRDSENRVVRHPASGFLVTPSERFLVNGPAVPQHERHCPRDSILVDLLLKHAVDAREAFGRNGGVCGAILWRPGTLGTGR